MNLKLSIIKSEGGYKFPNGNILIWPSWIRGWGGYPSKVDNLPYFLTLPSGIHTIKNPSSFDYQGRTPPLLPIKLRTQLFKNKDSIRTHYLVK